MTKGQVFLFEIYTKKNVFYYITLVSPEFFNCCIILYKNVDELHIGVTKYLFISC